MSDLSPIQEHIVKANEAYAKDFTKSELPLPPAKHYAISTSPLLIWHSEN